MPPRKKTKTAKKKVPSIVVHNGSSTPGSPAMDAASHRGTGLEKQTEGDEPPAAEDVNHRCSSETEDKPPPSRVRSQAKVKLLVRSHAVREEASPPPDPGPSVLDAPQALSQHQLSQQSPTSQPQGTAVSNDTLRPTTGNRPHKLRHQGSSQGSGDSCPSPGACLSRDSSTEQAPYTDSSGVDLQAFLAETLSRSTKDRQQLFRVENELINLARDAKRTHFKFPPMSSYQRMLVHRAAAYYGMEHNVDPTGSAVIVNRTRVTRLPDLRFRDLMGTNSGNSGSQANSASSNTSGGCGSGSRCCPQPEAEARVSTGSTAPSANSGNNSGPEEPRRSILKRDSASFEDTFKSPERQLGCDPPRRSKSFEEREEEYERARQRIFHHHHHHNPSTNHHRPSSGGASASPSTTASVGSGTASASATVCHDGAVSEDCDDASTPGDPITDSIVGEDEEEEDDDVDGSDWPHRGAPWDSPPESTASATTDHLLRPSAALHGGSQQQQRLLKVESFEGRDTLKANSLRPQVSKSYSFGGYPGAGTQAAASDVGMGAGPRMLLTKQDSGSSSVSSRLSPSTSSGYKSQSQRSDATLSATPSPTATPTGIPGSSLECQTQQHPPQQQQQHQQQQSPTVMWVVTSMSAVPPGSVLINPQTGRPVVNDDGTVYRWDPSNPPLSLDLCEVSESKPAPSDWNNLEITSSVSPCNHQLQQQAQEQLMPPEKPLHDSHPSSQQQTSVPRCSRLQPNLASSQQQQQPNQLLAQNPSQELSLPPQENSHSSAHQNSQQTAQPSSLSPLPQSLTPTAQSSAQIITESSQSLSQPSQSSQQMSQSSSQISSLSSSQPSSQPPQQTSQSTQPPLSQSSHQSAHKSQQQSPQPSQQPFQPCSQQSSPLPQQISQPHFQKQSQPAVQQHSQSTTHRHQQSTQQQSSQQSPQASQTPSRNSMAVSSPVPQQFSVPSQGSVTNSSPRVTTTATSPAPPPASPPSQQNSHPPQQSVTSTVTCIPVSDPSSAHAQASQVQAPTVHQYHGQPLVSTQHGSGAELVFTPQPLMYLSDPRTAAQPPPPAPEPTAATLHDLSGYFMGMSLPGQEPPPPPPQPQQPPPPPPPPPPSSSQQQPRANPSAGAGGGDTSNPGYGVPYWAQQQQQQQTRQPPAALYYVPAGPVQVAAASPPSAAAAAAVAAAAAAAVASHHHHHHPHPHHRYLTASYPQPAYAPQGSTGPPPPDGRPPGPAPPPPPAAVSGAHGLVAHAGGYVTTGYHSVAATSAYSPATANGGSADCGVPTAVYPATQLQPIFYPHPATAAPAPAPAPTPPHTPTQTQALCHPAAGYMYLNGGYAGPQPPPQPPPPSLFNGGPAGHMTQAAPAAPQPPHPHPLLPSLHVFPRPSVQMLSGVRSSPPPRPRCPPNTGVDQSLPSQSHKGHSGMYHHRPGMGKESRLADEKAAQQQQQQQQQQLGYPTTLPLLGLRLVPAGDMRLVGAPISAGPGGHSGLRVPFSPVGPPGSLRMPPTSNLNDPSGGNGRPPRARKPRCKMPMSTVSGPTRTPTEERSTTGHKTGAAPAPCC